jgi:hypothetical protein
MNRNAPTVNANPAIAMVSTSNSRIGSQSPLPLAVTRRPTAPQEARKYAGHAAAVFEATASGTAIASVAAASKFVPLAAATGGAWVAGAALSEFDNRRPRNNVRSASNFINGVAGATQFATAFLTGGDQIKVGYTSAATWIATAATNIGVAIADRSGSTRTRVALGASGALNLVAAGLTAAVAAEASEGNSSTSRNLGLAAGAFWAGGAFFQLAAVLARRQASAGPIPESDA